MAESNLKKMTDSSYLSGANASYIESLYDDYLIDPQRVEKVWRDYFDGLLAVGDVQQVDVPRCDLVAQFRSLAYAQNRGATTASTGDMQFALDGLIDAYRRYGHTMAQLDPLDRHILAPDPRLDPAFYHIDLANGSQYATRGIMSEPMATAAAIVAKLKLIYASRVGFEYAHVMDFGEEQWLQEKIESVNWSDPLTKDASREVLRQLVATEGLEKFLDAKYVGQTRFSVTGSDSIIPLLCKILTLSMDAGVKQVLLGMAHRGRVNVMLNILGKLPESLFAEFAGTAPLAEGSGDVKYHMGYSCDMGSDDHPMHVSLAYNPSHLEFIDAVGMGIVRAKQDDANDEPKQVLPLFIHGDSAFCGEGVVTECMQMSNTRAYTVAGSLHVVLNNQVGFTTSDIRDARSSRYQTAPANLIHAPVFHVNGEDLAAVIHVARLALEYRMRFHKDVVIDLVGFRRPGHNEADEPRATQPMMYKKVDTHPGVIEKYIAELESMNYVNAAEVKAWRQDYRARISKANESLALLPMAQPCKTNLHHAWEPFIGNSWRVAYDMRIAPDALKKILQELYANLPEHLQLQSRVAGVVKNRLAMAAEEKALDWGAAETLAMASLIKAGHGLRFSGQDSRRGTFFHRHFALFDQNTGEAYEPMRHLSDQVGADVYDSILAETGVLGFEYGYSTAAPKKLVIWEAQYGDFANVAQIIFDQFICSGWQKWNRLSGLVVLLPHGYKGQGPEHSSARLERFLQLAGQENMQICFPTTPAQMFNLLRRQVLRPYRKPLIVMTPKSLLRHPKMSSSFADCARGVFDLVLDDASVKKPKQIKRLVVCTGKVYFDLIEKRDENKIKDIAVIRIEQLYPFPYEEFAELMQRYGHVKTVAWCQEEPKNQGAWFITEHRLRESMQSGQNLVYAGREPMAAPAPGYSLLYKEQQNTLLCEALNINE